MHAEDLKGRAVVTIANANKIGQVDDVLFDADYRNVLGFRVKRGLIHRAEALPRAAVRAIGADAITVADESAVNSEDRVPELTGAVTLKQASNTKVVTEGGDLIGVVSGIEVDDAVQRVTGYTLAAALLERVLHGTPTMRAEEVLSVGQGGIMIVQNSVGEQLRGTES